jgi:hypothetical protein
MKDEGCRIKKDKPAYPPCYHPDALEPMSSTHRRSYDLLGNKEFNAAGQ